MHDLFDLERAVLDALIAQTADKAPALHQQLSSARVVDRENTGAGFYTRFAITAGERMDGVGSPLGDIGAEIEGLKYGMGFLLWLRDGAAEALEGYTYTGDSTVGLDFAAVRYSAVGPRLGPTT